MSIFQMKKKKQKKKRPIWSYDIFKYQLETFYLIYLIYSKTLITQI